MAFCIVTDRVHKYLIPMNPSSGSTNFPIRGDLAYHTTDAGCYAACSSVTPSTFSRKIAGIVEIASTASSNVGYLMPVSGELLEADMTTKLADALTSTGSTSLIGHALRFEFSTAYGTLVDVSTAPVDNFIEGSTEIAGGTTNAEAFVITSFSTARRKVQGFIPSGYCF